MKRKTKVTPQKTKQKVLAKKSKVVTIDKKAKKAPKGKKETLFLTEEDIAFFDTARRKKGAKVFRMSLHECKKFHGLCFVMELRDHDVCIDEGLKDGECEVKPCPEEHHKEDGDEDGDL